MFNFPIPSKNKMIKIEDDLYFHLLKELGHSGKVVEHLIDNPCKGFEIIDYTFEYKPLSYQIS